MKTKMSAHGGFAIVYGLAVLLIATISGTAILFLTQKDRSAGADYAGMRASSRAALAALKAFEGQCAIAPDTSLAILKRYISDHTYKWLLGPTAAVANTEQKIEFCGTSNGPKYSARIIGYDSVTSLITVEGIGYDGSGGKKKVTASYRLDGLKYAATPPKPAFAAFLGGALQNVNDTVNITGDVYLSLLGDATSQHFNYGGRITGNLKTRKTTDTMLDISDPLTVTGKAWMRCKLQPKDTFKILGKAAFEKGFQNFDKAIDVYGTSYFNQSSNLPSANCIIGHSNTVFYYDYAITSDRFTSGFSSKKSVSSLMSLADSMGMSPNDERPDTVILPSALTDLALHVSGGSVSANTVENLWTNQRTAGKLYKDKWLVLQLDNDITGGGGGPFTKKVIIMTGNHSINAGVNWYDCADTSNTFIYITGTGLMNDFGVPDNKKFRGYIYVNSSSNVIYKFGKNTTFYGAICHAKGSSFNLNTGPKGTLNIIYGPGSLGASAVAELSNLGLIQQAGTTVFTTPGLNLADLKIRPSLLGIQM